VIAGCLHNAYVLDDDAQVERLFYYFQERTAVIAEHIWKIGQASKWNLWARPLDVVLLEDHCISLTFAQVKEVMTAIERPWSPTAFAAVYALSATHQTHQTHPPTNPTNQTTSRTT
jgi:hypothetical protein